MTQSTLPRPEVDEHSDPIQAWQQEASLISNSPARPPPQFVPATFSYDGWIHRHAESSKPNGTSSNKSFGDNISGWYRSLTSQTTAAARDSSDTTKASPTTLHTSSSSSQEPIASPVPKSIRQNKNNWFIMKAIQMEQPSSSSVSTSIPTLAEILARDPPPLPSEEKYTPPVWLEIGPSNKGFGMLQRSGWNEGEPLGPNVPRRKPVKDILPDDEIIITTKSKDKGKGRLKFTSLSCQQTKTDALDEISELRNIEVIDLTLSDSDSDDSSMKAEDGNLEDGFTDVGTDILTTHGGIALLTPIATILKSDRLGIGLKAKTAGPYKTSQKRVTHNAAALAAHIKAAEQNRRRMKEHGRGRRGHQKQRRKEEEKRKTMLASLKS
jgi:hypothetical protein